MFPAGFLCLNTATQESVTHEAPLASQEYLCPEPERKGKRNDVYLQ